MQRARSPSSSRLITMKRPRSTNASGPRPARAAAPAAAASGARTATDTPEPSSSAASAAASASTPASPPSAPPARAATARRRPRSGSRPAGGAVRSWMSMIEASRDRSRAGWWPTPPGAGSASRWKMASSFRSTGPTNALVATTNPLVAGRLGLRARAWGGGGGGWEGGRSVSWGDGVMRMCARWADTLAPPWGRVAGPCMQSVHDKQHHTSVRWAACRARLGLRL